jgi:hypothetical protein
VGLKLFSDHFGEGGGKLKIFLCGFYYWDVSTKAQKKVNVIEAKER